MLFTRSVWLLAILISSIGSGISFSTNMAYALPLPPFFPPHNNIVSQPQLHFTPWGGNSNNMIIKTVHNGSGSSIYRIAGNIGNQSSGFASQLLKYTGNYISLSVGNVSKKSILPHDNHPVQVSFNFQVLRNNHYLEFSIVHGPIYRVVEGWNGNHFYKTVASHSRYNFDLSGSALERITVIVQDHSMVMPADFGIDFH
jgi:hypothetical protein